MPAMERAVGGPADGNLLKSFSQAQPVAEETVDPADKRSGGQKPKQYPLHRSDAADLRFDIGNGARNTGERFSQPVSVTRQLSSRRKPMPHSS